MPPNPFPELNFTKCVSKTIRTNRTFPLLKFTTPPQVIDCKTVLTYLYIKMVANTGTDAAPRSRAFALGFAGSCRAVLCLQPFFQNIILSPIENVPFAELRPRFLALFLPFPNSKRTFCKVKF
jgi:hypothetical protein